MVAATATWVTHNHWPWLRNRRWDLTFIIFSSVLVAVPLTVHYVFGVPTQAFNFIVAALVGGPHMYSTFTLTFWEGAFWRRYPVYTVGAFLIPVAVIYLAVVNLTLLVTIFMAWASFHVLQQIAYLADCYRVRAGEPLWSRSQAIDYAVLFTSLYPIAMYKLTTDSFRIGSEPVHEYFPVVLKTELFLYLVWAIFALALALWLLKTVQEYQEGRINYPKTLLLAITVTLSFIIPSFENLDVAFQGMNTWHSLQYLALLWYISNLRRERDEISSGIFRRIVGERRVFSFYGFFVGLTLVAGAMVLLLYWSSAAIFGWGLQFQQCYFIVVLSFLLMHYYFDTFLFTRVGMAVPGSHGLSRG